MEIHLYLVGEWIILYKFYFIRGDFYIMNLRKILIIITISLIILIGINIGITNIYNSNIEQNSRTV